MSIFKILKKEHDNIKKLFKKLEGESLDERTFNKLNEELDLHMEGEEKFIYPETKKVLSEETLEAIEEHHAAKMIQKEIEDMSGNEENIMAKAKVLKEIVEHHIKEEEERLFPKCEKNIEKETQSRMEKNYTDMRSELLAKVK